MMGIFNKYRLIKQLIIITVGFFLTINKCVAQQQNGIQKINASTDSLLKKYPTEKLYIQTDRSFYTIGDTLWLKGYLFDSQYLTAASKSRLVYADVVDKDNKVVKRMLYQADDGLFRGAIPLVKDELSPGNFTIRAYSNWMRNWGDEQAFTRKLVLLNTGKTFAGTDTSAVSATRQQKKTRQTDQRQAAKTDLQFMPEGGSLVDGLTSKVAFKAVAVNGLGVNISGKIVDASGIEVVTLKTTYAGMGYFKLTPKTGEKYFAIIDNSTKSYQLPRAKPTGLVLQIENTVDSKMLKVNVIPSANINANEVYYLVGQSRGAVCYGAIASFNRGVISSVIEKSKFPTGIARFTVFDKDLVPVCERITFIDHHDALKISLNTNKNSYQNRDSVALSIKVTDQHDAPVQGSFSVAVTDDGLALTDSSSNILTHLLLTGDLKGNVETPHYYLVSQAANFEALECLMLTQGWVGYHWTNNFKFPEIKYPPQSEFAIKGRITNLLKKGLPNIPLKLFSRRPFFTMDTLTNQAGEFTFRNIPAIDTGNFLLQAVKKNNKTKMVDFEMQDEEPLPVNDKPVSNAGGYFADSTLKIYTKNNVTEKKKAEEVITGKNVLKEVVIKAKKIVKGSKNLNGPGNADQVLDEKDINKVGKTTLLSLLYNKIEGFHEGIFPVRGGDNAKFNYMIKMHCVKLIFDGIDADLFFPNDNSKWGRQIYMKGVLEQFSAEDIKGIEVMYKSIYNTTYNVSFVDVLSVSALNDIDYAYIEITTRSGRGPLTDNSGGFYLYKPLMPTLVKDFYSPVYKTNEAPIKTDFRATIHWEPDVITDQKGEATLKFYTSDRKTTYTVIAEGSNMAGAIGFGSSKMKVE